LETPFTSMIDAAKTFYPYIPVSLLLKDKFDNKSKIKNIKVPILIMHGEADQIVPFFMGKKMFEKANMPNISVYDGSLSKILGCMFSPTACEDMKKAQEQNSNQTKEEADEEFTKEFDQIDEDLNKE
jgi:dienelactone hydrolase